MLWTRELTYSDFISLVLASFVDTEFCFLTLHSDDDDPKKYDVAAPLLDVLTASKELPQEETVVTKSLTIPPI
jgi:hypothetical protein